MHGREPAGPSGSRARHAASVAAAGRQAPPGRVDTAASGCILRPVLRRNTTGSCRRHHGAKNCKSLFLKKNIQ